jgi:TPR repeat protein
MEWFLRAAGQDYSWAQNIIGDMYRDGLGVPKNQLKAQEWYLKASPNGKLTE